MMYNITVVIIDEWLWECTVTVKDGEKEVLKGKTHVCCETEQEARDYVEKTFLPDLRNNYPRQLSGLVFPWEIPTTVESVEEVVEND